jgi:hypothetical protein
VIEARMIVLREVARAEVFDEGQVADRQRLVEMEIGANTCNPLRSGVFSKND